MLIFKRRVDQLVIVLFVILREGDRPKMQFRPF